MQICSNVLTLRFSLRFECRKYAIRHARIADTVIFQVITCLYESRAGTVRFSTISVDEFDSELSVAA